MECGTATAEKLRKVQQHNSHLALHVVIDDARAAQQLTDALAETKLPRAATAPSLWVIDAALTKELASNEDRRQRWSVTIVGDHLYIDANGKTFDGAVVRS